MRKFLLKIYLNFKFRKQGIKTSPFSILKELNKSQYWQKDKIEKEQLEQINKLIKESIRNVKYYQGEEYRDKLNFDDLKEFSGNFPVLTKEIIRENAGALVNEKIDQRISHVTSGSTGRPSLTELGPLAETYRLASRMRFFNWWGVDFFDHNVLIWSKPKRKGLYAILKKIEYRFLGILELDVFNINENSIHEYFHKMENFKAKYIRGYKSGIIELARLMDKFDLRFNKSHLKVVVVTAEVLFDNDRNYIERILNCKVANEYGSADAGQYANECPEGSLHINEESVYISFENSRNIRVTELFNNGMPLINYENQDRASLSNEQCVCGRNLRVIERVEGRTGDYMLYPDGSKKHSYILGVIFNKIEKKYGGSISQFRGIQTGNNLKIKVIPGKNFKIEVIDDLENLFSQEISKNLKIEIQMVDQIEREKSGKLRSFIRMN